MIDKFSGLSFEPVVGRCRCIPYPPVNEDHLLNAQLNHMEEHIMNEEPDYYAGNGLSPLEAFKKGLLSREETIGFIKGNIIKYVTRAGHKHNASEDMVKAIDYCCHLKRLYEHEMQNKPHLEADLAPIDFNDDTAKQAKETVINAFESLDKIQDVRTKP